MGVKEPLIPGTIEIEVLCKCKKPGVLVIDPHFDKENIQVLFWVRHQGHKLCDVGTKLLKNIRILDWEKRIVVLQKKRGVKL